MPLTASERWRLRGAPGPALRRGFVVATPVGIAVAAQLELDDRVIGEIGVAMLFAGFIAFDAPPLVRAGWIAATAPLIGLAACLGALSASSTVAAVAAMATCAAAAGLGFAVSMRFAIAGLTCVLSLLVAQGLYPSPSDAGEALLFGTLGASAQAMAALGAAAFDSARSRFDPRRAALAARASLADNLSLRSPSGRHAIRFSVALAVGVAIYRIAELGEHGYWVPLTILFVLRPGQDDTLERVAMRAAGTVIGLVLATALAELLGADPLLVAIVLTAAAACSYAFLALEYAIFTTAITTYVVLLTDALGSPAYEAAGERALATAIGIAVAAAAFAVLGEADRGQVER